MAEKDYAKIAAAKIVRPSKVVRKPKLFLYGRNKKGKTTFANSAGPHTLILDPEFGTSEMKTQDPHVWPIHQWTDLDDAYGFARSGLGCQDKECAHGFGHPFTWVGVDGLTRISNMSLKYVMKLQEEKSLDRIPGLVQQRDYGKAGELMKDLLTRFHNLDMGVVYTAQERMIEASDSEEDEDAESEGAMYVPDLPKGVRGMVNSLVDVIGRIYVVKVEIKGEVKAQRRLWISESVKYDTGYRSDFTLPEMLKNPTVPRLTRLMREGSLTRSA